MAVVEKSNGTIGRANSFRDRKILVLEGRLAELSRQNEELQIKVVTTATGVMVIDAGRFDSFPVSGLP